MTPPEGPESFQRFLGLLGQLNYTWTNTESLLIHMIGGLGGMPKDVAVIVFLTLNTTRARIDLAERLAKRPGVDRATRDEVLALTAEMKRHAGLRNRYNHCIYSFEGEGSRARSILMRIADRKDEIKLGQTEEIDDAAIGEVTTTIARLAELNRAMWAFFARKGYA